MIFPLPTNAAGPCDLRVMCPEGFCGRMLMVVDKSVYELLKNLVIAQIQMFYDDPPNNQQECADDYQLLKSTAEQIGLNFEEIVKEQATDFEVKRVEAYLRTFKEDKHESA